MIDKLQGVSQTVRNRAGNRTGVQSANAAAFGDMLQRQIAQRDRNASGISDGNAVNVPNGPQSGNAVSFSKHALARVEERGIELTPDLMGRLADSVGRAQDKGAKNILAFDNSQAFIINIPYGRVITAMSGDEMKENIFTNIDGAVLL